MNDYSKMDEALERLAEFGPDLQNGLTNHAPMAAEALSAMGRADAVGPWIDRYRKGLMARPAASRPIPRDDWRAALGRPERASDWGAFFSDVLRDAPWRAVVAEWTAILAPGFCGSATHGVIRVGHAVRSLGERETPPRLAELAEALASWASNFQKLPERDAGRATGARDALARVPIVPPDRRTFSGTIVSSLEALDGFPPFAEVIGLLDVSGEPASGLTEMTEAFARAYLANAHDVLSSIVFVHSVTSLAALRSILALLSMDEQRRAMRYAWQSACGLYSSFASSPPLGAEIEAVRESAETLIDRAVANGDEHAIKMTEACLGEWLRNPSAAYLAAARHAVATLPPA